MLCGFVWGGERSMTVIVSGKLGRERGRTCSIKLEEIVEVL